VASEQPERVAEEGVVRADTGSQAPAGHVGRGTPAPMRRAGRGENQGIPGLCTPAAAMGVHEVGNAGAAAQN
jgi:hypothetical protein